MTSAKEPAEASKRAFKLTPFEQRLSVLDAITGDISVVREDKIVVFLSSELRSQMGDLVGQKCFETDLGSPDVCKSCPMSRGFSEVNFPYVRVAKTNLDESVEITVTLLVDPDTEKKYYVATERDVSKEAEGERQITRLTHSLDQMAEPVAVLDTEGRAVYANRAFMNMTGMDEKAVHGFNMVSISTAQYPGKSLQSVVKQAMDKGWEGEMSGLRKDGSRYFAFIEAQPVRDREGKSLGVVGIFRDITKEKTEKVEFERYKSQLEARMESRTKELAKKVSQLTTLNKISRVSTSILDPDELMAEFVKAISTGFGFQHVIIMLMDKDRGELYFKSGYGPMISSIPKDMRQRLKEGIIGHAAYFSETLVTGDVESDPRYIKREIEHTKSELAVPVVYRGELLGVLDIQSGERDAFTTSDVTIMEMLADILASALVNARTYSEAREHESALTVLDRISKQISYRLEPSVILDQVAKDAATLLKAEKAMVGLAEQENSILSWVASYNIDRSIYRDLPFSTKAGVTGRALRRLKTEVVNSYEADPDASARDGKLFQIKSLVVAPMMIEGRGIGTINVYNKLGGKQFTRGDAVFLSSLADHAAIALENANLLASLNQRVHSQLTLLETAVSMQRQIDSGSIYENVADRLKEVVSYDSITMYRADHERRKMIPILARGPYVEQIMRDVFSIDEGISGYVARSGVAEIVNDTKRDKRVVLVPGTPEEEKEALMAIPLKSREKTIGVLALYREGGRTFSNHDFEIAQLFATQAIVAVENSELYKNQETLLKESTGKVEQMAKVLDLTTSVMYMDDLDRLLQRFCDAVVTSFGFSRASISLLDLERNAFVNRALSGYPDWVSPGDVMPVQTVLGDIADDYRIGNCSFLVKYEQQTYGIEAFDFLAHPENADKPRASADAWHERDILTCTLMDRSGRLIGYLLVDEPRDGKLPRKESIEVLEILAGMASIAVENANMFEKQSFALNEIALLNDLMTHDINNFNQGIMGYLELLLQDKRLDDSQRRYADKALIQVRNNARLIDNIRKLSKVRAMSDRDLVPMDIQPAISAAVEAVTRQQTEKEVVIGSAVLPGQHFILANHYLNDLFLNIVSNSVKFDGARKVKVEITVSDENTPQGAYWVVSVADRGRGIPDDRKKAVFERFATGMTGIKGFGLGLSIVSTIIEKYGGRIWVEDRISGDFSKGAVFKIMLPKAVKPSETKHLAA